MQTGLITGATGLISAAAVARLGRHYTLRALNRRALSGLDCHRADIADLDASRPLPDRPTQSREYCVWCSQRDAVQRIEKCLAAPFDLPTFNSDKNGATATWNTLARRWALCRRTEPKTTAEETTHAAFCYLCDVARGLGRACRREHQRPLVGDGSDD